MRGTGGRFVLAALACLCLAGCGGSSEKYEIREAAIQKMEDGDYAGAVELFDQAIEKSDGFVGTFELDVLKYRAQAEYESGDYAAAAVTYDILRQADEERPEYLERLGILYALEGKADEAVQMYEKLAAADPDNQEAGRILLLAGQQLTRDGREDEAIALFQDAVNSGRESGAVYNQLALSEMEAGEYDRALEYIQRGLALQDDARRQLLYNQAAAYERKLAFSNALQSLMRYSQEFGSTPEVEKEIAFLGSRIQ